MKELYLIVHESVLHNPLYLEGIEEDPAQIIEFIDELKNRVGTDNYLESPPNASFLPEGLPEPSDNLHVWVVGAFERRCCLSQVLLLRDNGYSADLLKDGCFNGGLPDFLWYRPDGYAEKYPDLFQ